MVLASLHCCSQCTRIFGIKTSATFHAAKTGHAVRKATGVVMREVRPADLPLPNHVRTLDTTIHSCSCGGYHSLFKTNAVAHAMRCGGAVAKRALTLAAEPDGPPPDPIPPSQQQQQQQSANGQPQQQQQQERLREFAVAARKGERPSAKDGDPLFERIVEDLSATELAAAWLVLLDDADDVDDFDWAAISAPVAWRVLRARAGEAGRVIEWTASDGRRIATRIADFKRQMLVVCAAACVAAARRANFADKTLVERARVFEIHMEGPCDEWAGGVLSRADAVRAWARTVDDAAAAQASVAKPLCAAARRWLTGTCIARMCDAIGL
jgi:hypothetical protein